MIKNPHTKIKQIRELKNLTQEYIADRLNLSIRAYSKIEAGETQLTINRLNEISEILEIDPIELLGFDHQQIFNNCKQEGNIGINYIQISDKLIEQYERHIKTLQDQIQLLNAILSK